MKLISIEAGHLPFNEDGAAGHSPAPSEDRLPTLMWLRQLPVCGGPAEVVVHHFSFVGEGEIDFLGSTGIGPFRKKHL
jgi:hypothetical protein